MKILHVGKYFPPFHGGLENYMRDLMVALKRRGISSTALVHQHEISFRNDEGPMTLSGHEFEVVRTGTWVKWMFAPISPAFPWQLRRLIRKIRPDVLHLHVPNLSAFWALLLPSARRVPWVVHWHADVITATQGGMMTLAYAFYRPFEQALLRRAAAVVVTSPPYRDSSEPLQPWLAKCRVVPLGLDTGRLIPDGSEEPAAKRSEDESRSCPTVLAVGRLTYYKGFRHLIEAIAQVADLQLDLVGEGRQSDELQRLIAHLGLQERVKLHGKLHSRKLARMMADCDCLCMPSIERTEAFGMVLLEAMSLGKATVVSDVPGSGMGWVVDHGVTGLKVPPADSAALAEAFRTLMAGRERFAAMGRTGREKFARMFEINQAVDGIIDTYQAVLGSLMQTGDGMQRGD